ncbi:MAG: right-handed parallel beta-helix repeat-containing protein, partial [Thermoplasmata archaeon]|nr:right-handed parallel beta-helix repeat-containing protein [Thermoplasmata archaeon]
MKVKLKSVSISIICLLILSGLIYIPIIENDPVTAKTLYVGGTGGGNYSTIQTAIAAANNGDTVYVYAGTYTENININNKITLVGASQINTTIDGGGTGHVIQIFNSNGVKISGFKITNGGTNNSDAGIAITSSTNCLILNNNVSSNGFYGLSIQGTANSTVTTITVKNNTVTNNQGSGMIVSDSNDNNIINNVINNNCLNKGPNEAGLLIANGSNNNNIFENEINNNNISGVLFSFSDSNLMELNSISGNQNGIHFQTFDSNNVFYFNKFINNTIHVSGTSASRSWYSPVKSTYLYNNTNFTNYLGNYWDDYSGTDNDGDGIGDSPHSIASDYDYFPLIKPFENYILIPTSIKVEMDATNSNFTDKTVSLITQEATLNATVSGDFNGTYNATKLELVIINSSSFAGSGFFKAKWIATIEGKPYNGTWQGMLFQQPEDIKIYFKGTIFGGLQGITDGYLLESVTGSGTYDLYNSTWTIGYIGSDIVFAKLTLNGTVEYQTSKESTTLIYILQVSLEGKSKGYYNGSLNVVLTHVCINNKTNQYHGEGFSYITYICTYGSGTGWTYDKNV